MKKIRILNLHKKYRLNEPLIKKVIRRILKFCGRRKKIELGFVFLGDKAIAAVNKRYKFEGSPTDVLSFDLDAAGEIFISLDRALRNSRIFGTKFEDEITLYVIHGILHLSGYDDETPRDKRRMSKKQDEILKYLWKKENLSKVLTPR
ncbi:MAG: rRNA maturation RNase YbeY [Candidatus Omnitrophica bacterium]|nr:rRNA maturation RNase YbeY [Candidatus Omnitrophota bacterium]